MAAISGNSDAKSFVAARLTVMSALRQIVGAFALLINSITIAKL
jgi:hypothetical protein